MKCPKCALFNPPGAEFCDCGYSFTGASPRKDVPNISFEERSWTIALNLAGLLTLLNFYLGIVAVFAIWLVKRREFQFLNHFGKNAINFWAMNVVYKLCLLTISLAILSLPESADFRVTSGFVLAMSYLAAFGSILVCVGCIYSIIGATKANEGKVFSYPGGISFFR